MTFTFVFISILVFIALIGVIILCKTFFIVQQQSVAIIERFGKYHRSAHAGLQFKIPFIEWIVGHLSLRIQQLDAALDAKTKDNMMVKIQISVQYRIKTDRLYDAFYKLVDDEEQITAYVLDLLRAEIPTMNLDDAFAKKDNIANVVKNELADTMQEFGYEIVKILITNIEPQESIIAGNGIK